MYLWLSVCACVLVPVGGALPARRPRRELRSEWSISKPGRALPPPTGTAAGPPVSSTPAVPAARSGRSRGPPWPCHRPPAPRPGPAGPAVASYRSGLIAVSGQALPPPTGTTARPIGVVRIRWGFCAMRSLLLGFRRRVGGLDGVIPPARWRRGLGLERCCCQSADPLDAKHPQTTVLAEWVCTLADSLSGVAWWSHAKPLAGMRTRYVARNSPATT